MLPAIIIIAIIIITVTMTTDTKLYQALPLTSWPSEVFHISNRQGEKAYRNILPFSARDSLVASVAQSCDRTPQVPPPCFSLSSMMWLSLGGKGNTSSLPERDQEPNRVVTLKQHFSLVFNTLEVSPDKQLLPGLSKPPKLNVTVPLWWHIVFKS